MQTPGWAGTERNATGFLVPEADHFPNGMKAVVDYVHSKQISFGLYTCSGSTTCVGGRQGSFGHWKQDADLFAEWGCVRHPPPGQSRVSSSCSAERLPPAAHLQLWPLAAAASASKGLPTHTILATHTLPSPLTHFPFPSSTSQGGLGEAGLLQRASPVQE